jgi:hypothetical protein
MWQSIEHAETCFGNFPTWRAAEGSSNPGSFGATTSGFSESACGAIFLVVAYVYQDVKVDEAENREQATSFVSLLTLVKFEVDSALGLSVSHFLPDLSMGRGGVI